MPSRKQRRRREKSFRHEYETVLLDEEGNELPLDREQERAARQEREQQRTKDKAASAPAKRGGRLGREPQPPSWRRAIRRGGLMGAVIFVAFVFILKGGSPTSRAAVAIVYAVAFIPLTYWIDRFAYRSYQRRLARQHEKKR
jgi:hypothetical protein